MEEVPLIKKNYRNVTLSFNHQNAPVLIPPYLYNGGGECKVIRANGATIATFIGNTPGVCTRINLQIFAALSLQGVDFVWTISDVTTLKQMNHCQYFHLFCLKINIILAAMLWKVYHMFKCTINVVDHSYD